MKKTVAVILCLIMTAGALCACSDSTADTTSAHTSPATDAITTDTVTTEPTPAVIAGQTVKVMGYNLDANMNTYRKRSDGMLSIMQSYTPDSIGVQEARPGWMKFLIKELKGYSYIGVNANGKSPEDNGYSSDDALSTYIFYNSAKYKVVDSGTFWLSKTPDTPSIYSNTVDCFRTCNWVVLKDINTGFTYAHFNAHLDWMDVKATDYQISLIRDQMAKVIAMGIPVFATGDYNTDEGSSTYSLMLKNTDIGDSKFLTDDSMDIGTYPSYGDYDVTKTKPIDFCFVSKDMMTVAKYRVVNDKPNDAYVSDHFGIFVEAAVNEQTDVFENAPAPEFPEADLTVSDISDSSMKISFPAAKDSAGIKEYYVSVKAPDAEANTIVVPSKFRYNEVPSSYTVMLTGLTANTEYTVSVDCINLYLKKSAALNISAKTTETPAVSTLGDADIFDLAITSDGVSDNSAAKLELAAAPGGAPAVSGNALVFDGTLKNYKASGITGYYDTLKVGFTMEINFSCEDSVTFANIMSNCHAGGFGFEVENGMLGFSIYTNGGYTTVKHDIEEGKYYHAVATYDGSELILYINGNAVDNATVGADFTFATDDGAKYLCVGADSDASGVGEYPATGTLSCARIYSKTATASDVAALYEAVK